MKKKNVFIYYTSACKLKKGTSHELEKHWKSKKCGLFNDSTLLGWYTSVGKNGTFLKYFRFENDQCTLTTNSETDILS